MTGSIPNPSTGSSRSPSGAPSASSTRWTFPYAALGGKDTLHPAIPGWLEGPNSKAFPLFALIDSGADASCFPADWAEIFGIDLGRCQEHEVQTGAGVGVHYEYAEPLSLTVREAEIKVPVRATFGDVGIPILGRSDFFEHFYVEVDEKNLLVHISLHEVDVEDVPLRKEG